MLQRDHIMRQIQQATQVIQRLLDLKEAGEVEKAQRVVNEAVEELLGPEEDPDELGTSEVVDACRTREGSFSADLAIALAELLERRGDISAELGEDASARASWRHALGLYERAIAVENAAVPLDIADRIERLENRLPD